MEPDLQPRAVELLTQRTAWAKPLLAAVADKKIPPSAISVNQVRKLMASKDPDVLKQVKATLGYAANGTQSAARKSGRGDERPLK